MNHPAPRIERVGLPRAVANEREKDGEKVLLNFAINHASGKERRTGRERERERDRDRERERKRERRRRRV
jgi:hypothetical protein